MPAWNPAAYVQSAGAQIVPTIAAAGSYYVDNYPGIHHDTVTKGTIQTTAGSNSIFDSAAGFTIADTGKLAMVTGAGVNAQHLIGYLVYVDASHCNLMNAPIAGIAVNAATTLSRNGTMVYGTDDSAAIAAAFADASAAGGTLAYGPYKYITSGTLGDTATLYQRGAARNLTQIYCTADYYWQNDLVMTTRMGVRDISFYFKKHGFNDTIAATNSSGFSQRIFENMECKWYTGCAFQNNTADGPWFKFSQCSFVGWDELETIGAAVGGLTDSTTFSACQFGGAHRVMLKFAHGGPNGAVEGNCGFISGLPNSIATLSDAAMTNGGNVVTSATDGRFDSSHVGLMVSIPNATLLSGVANVGTLDTVITAVLSATQVQVMDSATADTSAAAMIIRGKARAVRKVTDAVATAGSTTITSATAAFTSADKGCGINLPGAGWLVGTGGGAGDLNTRIQQVVNGTTIIVDEPAIASVTGGSLKINQPQIKFQLEPNVDSTNAGTGMTIDNPKFGSEKVLPGDIHIGICDSAVDSTCADGAMTSGSAVLTGTFSAVAGWVKTRYATVPGAAKNGGTLYARVMGYTSATSVTLEVAASTTVTGKTVQITKPRGERMPVLDAASTGFQIQTDVAKCQFGNVGNSANGVILAPIFTTTPNVRAMTFGLGNHEYGSAFLYMIEASPDVPSAADQYGQTNNWYAMTDDSAGNSRLRPKLSNRAGMFGTRVIDEAQTQGMRLPSAESAPSGRATKLSHLLKTRARLWSFTNAHKVNDITDADMGTDAAEYSFDTAAGICSATLLQADVAAQIGQPCWVGIGLKAGTTSPLGRVRIVVRYSGGTIHKQQYVDVPTSGVDYIQFPWVPSEATGNVQIQVGSDAIGQVIIGQPVVYRSRSPINFFRRDWLSPNGTSYVETINDVGTLLGVTAGVPFTKGLESARPAASSLAPGSVYFSTNMGVLWETDGSAWTAIAWDRERPKFGTTKTTMRENFPNWAAQTAFTIANVTAYAMAVDYLAGDVITTLTFGTAGTGFTWGTNLDGFYWYALYDANLNLLAYVPAVVNPTWGANTEKPGTITKDSVGGALANYVVPATGPILHVFYPSIGTGGVPAVGNMRGAALGSTSVVGGGSIGWGTRGGSFALASTQTPPASISPLVATTGLIYTKGYNP